MAKMRFGMVKFFAHRSITRHPYRMTTGYFGMYEPIPLFIRPIDRAITQHERRIDRAKTKKRRQGPSRSDWDA